MPRAGNQSSGAGSQPPRADDPKLSFVAAFEATSQRFANKRLYAWFDVNGREEASMTFAEVRERACAVCIALHQRWGAALNDRVLLVYPPGLDFAAAFLGCLYAGVCAVPYYPPVFPASVMPSTSAWARLNDGLAKLAHVAECCEPALVLSSAFYLRAKSVAMLLRKATSFAGGPGWPSAPSYSTDDLRLPARCSTAEREWLRGWLARRAAPVDPNELALLQFTSGSTGNPKGVMVSTRALLANVSAIGCCGPTPALLSSWDELCVEDRLVVVNWVPQHRHAGGDGARDRSGSRAHSLLCPSPYPARC